MGGYKDLPDRGPSSVRPSSDPRVGTVPSDMLRVASSGDAVAYGAAKLAAERLAAQLGKLHGNATTFVALRIGWCHPGDNRPNTLSADGSPPEYLSGAKGTPAPTPGDDGGDESWFKRMWLSNRDFLSYFTDAINLDVPATEHEGGAKGGVHRNERRGFVLLNAMSKNTGAKWNLEETEKWLGVTSEDDLLA